MNNKEVTKGKFTIEYISEIEGGKEIELENNSINNKEVKIEDQFLNNKGTWMIDFRNEKEYQEQMNKVRQTIRETTTNRDFDVLDDYLYLLKRNYTNFIIELERNEI